MPTVVFRVGNLVIMVATNVKVDLNLHQHNHQIIHQRVVARQDVTLMVVLREIYVMGIGVKSSVVMDITESVIVPVRQIYRP
jgi:hypothetical protein